VPFGRVKTPLSHPDEQPTLARGLEVTQAELRKTDNICIVEISARFLARLQQQSSIHRLVRQHRPLA
jgi:hypothetical protein